MDDMEDDDGDDDGDSDLCSKSCVRLVYIPVLAHVLCPSSQPVASTALVIPTAEGTVALQCFARDVRSGSRHSRKSRRTLAGPARGRDGINGFGSGTV